MIETVPLEQQQSGLDIDLDQAKHTATLADQYARAANFDSEYMGSIQPLPGGDELVGWG